MSSYLCPSKKIEALNHVSTYLEAVSKSPLGGRPSPLALFVGVGRANPELVLRIAPPEGKTSIDSIAASLFENNWLS